jgi:hypothetical protein
MQGVMDMGVDRVQLQSEEIFASDSGPQPDSCYELAQYTFYDAKGNVVDKGKSAQLSTNSASLSLLSSVLSCPCCLCSCSLQVSGRPAAGGWGVEVSVRHVLQQRTAHCSQVRTSFAGLRVKKSSSAGRMAAVVSVSDC